MNMLHRFVLMFVSVALALGLLACGEDPVSGQPTADPAATSVVKVRKATPIAVSSSLALTATLATTAVAPTPTSAEDARFADQRTRSAPTLAAVASQVATLANTTGSHHQWGLLTTAATVQQRERNGLAGFRSTNDGKGQQYSCAIYQNGLRVPRINLAFSRDLTYTVIINQAGERQGAVSAITTIAGVVAPVEWRTWTSRVDRIRLREDDAVRFVQALDDQSASEFRLELQDDPDLSATYDVSNLLTAITANEMTCFEGK